MSVDHTVTDGHSAITLLNNTLWDRYRTLVEDGDAAAGAAVAAEAVTEAPATAPEQPVWPTPVSELLPPVDEAETAAYLRRRLAETEGRSVELLPYDTPRGRTRRLRRRTSTASRHAGCSWTPTGPNGCASRRGRRASPCTA